MCVRDLLTTPLAPPLAQGFEALARRANREISRDGRPEGERPFSVGVAAPLGTVSPGSLYELLDFASIALAECGRVQSEQGANEADRGSATGTVDGHAGSGRPSSRFARAMPTSRSMRRASAIAALRPNAVMR